MKPIILIFFAFFILFSCKNTSLKEDNKIGLSKKDLHFSTYQFDTSTHQKGYRIVHKWTEMDDFFAVYRVSNMYMGIGCAIGDYPFLDTLLLSSKEDWDSIADSSGVFNLKRSGELLKEILDDASREFYIYCTKGVTKSHAYSIVYDDDECSSIILIRLHEIDTLKYGEPLIASKQLITLKYESDNIFQKDLENYNYIQKSKFDYKDAIVPKLFAYNDTYFFVYYDDFEWYKNPNSKCNFPARQIFKKEGVKVKSQWVQGLDLFGIPCD